MPEGRRAALREATVQAAPADPRASVVRTERAAPPPAPKVRSAATAIASCKARPTAADRICATSVRILKRNTSKSGAIQRKYPRAATYAALRATCPTMGAACLKALPGPAGQDPPEEAAVPPVAAREAQLARVVRLAPAGAAVRAGRAVAAVRIPARAVPCPTVSFPVVRPAVGAAADIRWWALSTVFDVFRNRAGVALVGSRRRWRSCLGVAFVGSL